MTKVKFLEQGNKLVPSVRHEKQMRSVDFTADRPEGATGPRSRFLTGFDEHGEVVPLHVVRYANADENAPVAVLLPFTGAHAGQMRRLARALVARGFHAVCVDLPGHGRSGGARGAFGVEQLFRSVRSVLEHNQDEFPLSRQALIGSSWGGDLALLYAMWEQARLERDHQPRIVDAVVGQAVITPWLRELFVHFRRGVGLLFEPTGIGKEFARRVLGKVLPLPHMFTLRDVYQKGINRRRFSLDSLTLKGYDTSSYLNYLTYQPEVTLGSLYIPVHLLIGDRDRLVRLAYEKQVFQRLRAEHSSTTFTVIPGGSHGLFEEFTNEAADVIQLQLHSLKRERSVRPMPRALTTLG